MIADAGKMHPDEQEIDPGLVRRLITEQFPQWADLPLVRVAPTGTDNALYRLGPDLVVRLPRIHGAVGDATKEHRLLPALAPYLPVPIPAPVALGTPAAGYPWEWSVYRWLPGESALTAPVPDPELLATQLAEFVSAMHRVDLPGGPAAGRGAPVRSRDQVVRRGIEAVGQLDTEPVDPAPLTEIWEGVLAAPDRDGPDVWVHGDLLPGNLLIEHGALSAVIDFGGVGIGDPACDLITAWSGFTGAARDTFRAALEVDDAAWARGRGWAMCVAMTGLPYYLHTNPVMVSIARHIIRELLAEQTALTR